MAEKASKRITCNLTEAQYRIVEQLPADGETLSSYLLRLLQEDANRQGLKWEGERNTWGGRRRQTPNN